MTVKIQVILFGVLLISVATGLTILKPHSAVHWQSLTPISIRENAVYLPCPNEGFFQHPVTCSKFYRCVDLIGSRKFYHRYLYECPNSLIFIPSLKTCISGKCSDSQPNDVPSTTEKEKLNDAHTALSNLISVLNKTQDILQNVDSINADGNCSGKTGRKNKFTSRDGKGDGSISSEETSTVNLIEMMRMETKRDAYLNTLSEEDRLKKSIDALASVISGLEGTQEDLQILNSIITDKC
ncbi:unnamed protein product [Meganyctiphanes norvegica]|uniref:Chitin-binding type-2 domain-containing protein n=1 Tax=Meganyctiphanes norvegica TaxID=48144 RepID=A0AAV2RBZ9_MEGNR